MDNPEKLATQDTQDTEEKKCNTTLGTTTNKQPQTTQNQEEKTNKTSFLCGNRSGNHNTELKTLNTYQDNTKHSKDQQHGPHQKTGVNASEIGEHTIVLIELYLTVDIMKQARP